MPKRPNPFGESSPLQYKTHIGKKELDMGVSMDQNMRAVYDRTKSLLFEGSKKTTGCSSCHDAQQWNAMESRDDSLQPLPGQMVIDPEGKIGGKADMNQQAPATNQNGVTSMMTDEAPSANSAAEDVPKSPSKQLRIDSSGKLYSGSSAVMSSSQPCTPGFSICSSCNHPSHIGTRRCNFCDKSTCTSCLNQCSSCQGLYCPVCSTLNYDDCVERSYCLQCPTNMV